MAAQILHFIAMADHPNRVYELRRQHGWSQQELAELVGCSKMHVSGLERGTREMSVEWLRRFAAAFGVSVADLLTDADNPDRLSPSERAMVERFRSADAADQEQLQRVAEALIPFRHRNMTAA